MAALGNPVDLASNIGSGGQDLVYEPYQGAVLGPKAFMKGVGRGSQGFVKGIVHGVSSSIAGVGSTVGRNLAVLTFDDDFKAKREQRLQVSFLMLRSFAPIHI